MRQPSAVMSAVFMTFLVNALSACTPVIESRTLPLDPKQAWCVRDLVFSLDDRRLYAGVNAHAAGRPYPFEKVRWWDCETGKLLNQVDRPNRLIRIAAGADGLTILEALERGVTTHRLAADGSVSAPVELAGGGRIHIAMAHGPAALSDDGGIAVYNRGLNDEKEPVTLCVVQTKTGAVLANLETESPRRVGNVAVSPDGQLVAALLDRTVVRPGDIEGPTVVAAARSVARVWHVPTGKSVAELGPFDEYCFEAVVSFTAGGRELAIGQPSARTVGFWDSATWRTSRPSVPCEREQLLSFCFGDQGRLMAVATWRYNWMAILVGATGPRFGDVVIWDLTQRKIVAKLNYAQPVYRMVFSHDAKRLATAAENGELRLWDFGT